MRHRRSRRSGLTLVETLLTIGLTGVTLFLVSGWMSGLRSDARRDLAVRMLRDLDVALVRYRRDTGQYPVGYGDDSRISAVVHLLDHPKSRSLIDAFPALLKKGPNDATLVDPWGTPLRFLGPDSDDPKVITNDGRPVFISAGPDRDFGDHSPAGLGDNLRSDDPGPDGFIDDVAKLLAEKNDQQPTTRGSSVEKDD